MNHNLYLEQNFKRETRPRNISIHLYDRIETVCIFANERAFSGPFCLILWSYKFKKVMEFYFEMLGNDSPIQ